VKWKLKKEFLKDSYISINFKKTKFILLFYPIDVSITAVNRQIERIFEEHKSGSKNEDTYDSSCFEHEKKYIIIQLITIILKY
jgi:hypothetical protein